MQHCCRPTPVPLQWDPTTPVLPTPPLSLATCNPHLGDAASHSQPVTAEPTALVASSGEKSGSEESYHTSYSQLWASSALEGSNNPSSPLPMTPLLNYHSSIAPDMGLSCGKAQSFTQIHTATLLGVQQGAELPPPALGTRGSCWISPGCRTANPWPLFCRNKVNAFSNFNFWRISTDI